jgi:hypothetical protein
MNTCQSCRFSFIPPGATSSPQPMCECRINPPVLQWLLMPIDTLQGRTLQPIPASGFPQIPLNQWCAQWACNILEGI